MRLDKTHFNDAISICCNEEQTVEPLDMIVYKKNVSVGDYQQNKGVRSHIKIPTGKLFGLRKFDLIKTKKGVGFVKGKRSSGFFTLMDIWGSVITTSVNVKKDCKRLVARTSTLTITHFPPTTEVMGFQCGEVL